MSDAEVFNRIASGWYNFRHWSIFRPELETLAQRWQKGRLLNIGCAHGPDFLPFKDSFQLFGLDYSIEMLKYARKYASKFGYNADLVQGDAANLPFTNKAFDWAIAVATYHHFLDLQRAGMALGELRRVLKPGGEAFITVWNRGQPRLWFRRRASVPWRTGGTVLYRHYYLFTYGELESLVKKAGLKLLESFPESSFRFPVKFFSRNICLLVKK
jgi:SAM-dependent methyltransferase